MNKKFLLAAMALPMLFTACSDEELFQGVDNNLNAPQAKGYYMTLAPTLGDIADSRATWLDANAKLEWDETDLISVYWLNNPAFQASQQLYGQYNSIFKTEDGDAFTSESLVFEGGNIAVYPGDVTFTKQANLFVNVPLSQDASTLAKVPYVSNYLQVNAPKKGQEDQIPGYNNGLYAPMKLAANVLYLDIELANTANLAQYNFKVDSVSLVTTVNKFADKAPILFSTLTPNDEGKVLADDGEVDGIKDEKADTVRTITHSVYVANTTATAKELTATSVTPKGNGKYQAKFVILPTQISLANNFSADTEIVIYTNCGRINLKTSKKATATATPSNIDKFDSNAPETTIYAGVVTGKKDANGKAEDQTIAQLLDQVVTSQVIDNKNSNFNGERMGMAFARTIQADMANATLNDSKVFTSDDIKNYVAIHTAMNSDKTMNLILSTREGEVFKSLTKDAIAAVDAKNNYTATPAVKNVTLSMDADVTGIEIVGGGAVYNAGKSFDGSADLVLAAGANWTMNDKDAWDNVAAVVNNGTLTIAGTMTDNNQNVLAETVKNNGTLKIGGNNKLQVADKLQNVSYEDDEITINGVVQIANGQNLVFNTNVESGIEGTIDVQQGGFLTVEANKSVKTGAVINNYGLVSAEDGTGGLINVGEINVKRDGAITYVQDNANGVINLLSRNNEAVVKTNKGRIVYNYDSATDGATFVYKPTDKFTYVVFGEGNPTITLSKTETNKSLSVAELGMTFTSETNLVVDPLTNTNNRSLKALEVAAGGHLQVLSGNDVTALNLVNNGIITVGGTIYYKTNYDKASGAVVYSVGKGAIVYQPAVISSGDEAEQNFNAAIAAGEGVELKSDLTLMSTLTIPAGYEGTIDLGGKTLTLQGASRAALTYGIDVPANGSLTIKNGKIVGEDFNWTICNFGTTVIEDCEVEGSVYNGNVMTVSESVIESTKTSALVSGNDKKDLACFLTLTDSEITSTVMNAAKLQNNYYNAKGLYTVSGTTFTGQKSDDCQADLCIAAANIKWGEGNVLTNDCVHLYDAKYPSYVNGEVTRSESVYCKWNEIYPEEEEK